MPRPVLALLLALLAVTLPPSPASAESPWSAADAQIAADIKEGRPLVVLVVVPLCDNDQIDCGSPIAGRPRDLGHNTYWGAVFGQRRFFERRGSGWTRLDLTSGKDDLLERAVYRRTVSRAPWGGSEGETVEQIVVLEAYDGAAIDEAVKRFYKLAGAGGRVRFQDGDKTRDARVSVAGYAGHNRLMDGLKLPKPTAPAEARRPIPSFVMACRSDAYFTRSLQGAGSAPLVMTRDLMAPEGYVVDAITRALGDNVPRAEVRARAVSAYAKWQRLSPGVASTIFAKLP